MMEIVTLSSDDNDSDGESLLKEMKYPSWYRPGGYIREGNVKATCVNNVAKEMNMAADDLRDLEDIIETVTRPSVQVVEVQKETEEGHDEPVAVTKDVITSKGKAVKRKKSRANGKVASINNITRGKEIAADDVRDEKTMTETVTRPAEEVVEVQKEAEEGNVKATRVGHSVHNLLEGIKLSAHDASSVMKILEAATRPAEEIVEVRKKAEEGNVKATCVHNVLEGIRLCAHDERLVMKILEPATRPAEEVVEEQKEAEEEDEEPASISKDVRSKGKGVKRKSTAKTKDSAAAEKQAKKQKIQEERQAKKAADERNKMYKPGECMKYMQVEGHPTLWSRWYMSDVGRELSAAGARAHSSAALCDPAVLVWTRSRVRALEAPGGQVRLSPPASGCDLALYIASAEEVCELVSSQSLSPHMARVQQLCDCRVTLVLFKLDDYFKSNRRKTSNSNRSPMNEIDLELALTDLLVTTNCDTVKVNTPNELALRIVQFTKAIAEAPFKKSKRDCDKQAESYLRGDNKNCIALGKDGAGNSRLWQQMIAVLPHSSLETARALCAQYTTPLMLYQALQTEGPGPLSSLSVRRAAGPAGRARRLGPGLARRLHALYTAQRGDLRLD